MALFKLSLWKGHFVLEFLMKQEVGDMTITIWVISFYENNIYHNIVICAWNKVDIQILDTIEMLQFVRPILISQQKLILT